MVYRVCSVYWVYRVYRAYRVYRIYKVYSVYFVYRVYRVYRMFRVYRVYSTSFRNVPLLPFPFLGLSLSLIHRSAPGLLAVRILGASDPTILGKMDQYMLDQEEIVMQKSAKLESIGYAAYLAEMKK